MDIYPLTIQFSRMSEADVPEVHQLETRCFSVPWDIASYYGEACNPAAHYMLARLAGQAIGFGGMWAVADEAHIVTLAVSPEFRRHGVGRRLLHALLNIARELKVASVTLEVRMSNTAARSLYSQEGFTLVGHRRRYYPDNGEDAAVMELLLDSCESDHSAAMCDPH